MAKPTWHQIQEKINSGMKIFDLELDVVYYGRVSTEKEYQLHSLESSNEFLEAFIRAQKKWSYVCGYVDEGISGTRADKRDDFLRMISESAQGKFSLIVTKEVSRFARNTRECLNYIKILKDNNVGIYFINDNILTFRDSDNFSLNIRGVIAEEESRNTSRRVSFGHSQSIKKGVVFGNGRMYGYDKTPGGLAVNENEAEMVRLIFDMYAYKEMSLHQIELELYDRGYRSLNNTRISHVTIRSIISNAKYKGYYVGNKVKIIDMQTKKQKFLDESEWIVYKDDTGERVPQIVDEATFDIASARYKARKKQYQEIRNAVDYSPVGWGRSPLSGKIYCAHCGAPYWRDVVTQKCKTQGREYWRCSVKKKNSASACPCSPIYLDEIQMLVNVVLSETKDTILSNAASYAKLFESKCANQGAEYEKRIIELKSQYSILEAKRDKLLSYNLDGKISDDQFLERNQKFTNELMAISGNIKEMQATQEKSKNESRDFAGICRRITKAFASMPNNDPTIDLTAELIDEIIVYPKENDVLPIEIKLCTIPEPKRLAISLTNRRSGSMVKKMIEAQERSMSGK